MRTLRSLIVLSGASVLALLAPGPIAQHAAAVQINDPDRLSSITTDLIGQQTVMEGMLAANLALKRELEAREQALVSAEQAYRTEAQRASAYCTGTFDKDEYRRRKAWCESTGIRLENIRLDLVAQRRRLIDEDAQRIS